MIVKDTYNPHIDFVDLTQWAVDHAQLKLLVQENNFDEVILQLINKSHLNLKLIEPSELSQLIGNYLTHERFNSSYVVDKETQSFQLIKFFNVEQFNNLNPTFKIEYLVNGDNGPSILHHLCFNGLDRVICYLLLDGLFGYNKKYFDNLLKCLLDELKVHPHHSNDKTGTLVREFDKLGYLPLVLNNFINFNTLSNQVLEIIKPLQSEYFSRIHDDLNSVFKKPFNNVIIKIKLDETLTLDEALNLYQAIFWDVLSSDKPDEKLINQLHYIKTINIELAKDIIRHLIYKFCFNKFISFSGRIRYWFDHDSGIDEGDEQYLPKRLLKFFKEYKYDLTLADMVFVHIYNLARRPNDEILNSNLLIELAKINQFGTLRFFINIGADVNFQDESKCTLLEILINKKHVLKLSESLNLYNFIVDKGLNLNSLHNLGMSYLHMALKFNDLNLVILLMQKGININVVDNLGNTTLHYLFNSTHQIIDKTMLLFDVLIEKGENINAVNNNGETPVYRFFKIASICHSKIIWKFIKNDKINWSLNNNITLNNWLSKFIRYGSDFEKNESKLNKILDKLYDLGLQEGPPIRDGFRLINFCIELNKYDLIKKLIDNNYDINTRDNFGNTTLHCALKRRFIAKYDLDNLECNKKIILLLINNGVNINARDKYDISPFKQALKTNDLEIIQAFIQKDVIANESEYTDALVQYLVDSKKKFNDNAIQQPIELMNLLISQGANVNCKLYEEPIIFFAIRYLDLNIVKLLIEKGANPYPKPNYDWYKSAHREAELWKKLDIVDYLREQGLDKPYHYKFNLKNFLNLDYNLQISCEERYYHSKDPMFFSMRSLTVFIISASLAYYSWNFYNNIIHSMLPVAVFNNTLSNIVVNSLSKLTYAALGGYVASLLVTPVYYFYHNIYEFSDKYFKSHSQAENEQHRIENTPDQITAG